MCGSTAQGCRLAFDAGPRGIRVAAVRDGEVLDAGAEEFRGNHLSSTTCLTQFFSSTMQIMVILDTMNGA